MSDKPREFWFSRKRVEIGASPVQTDYYNTRFYPQEEFERERARNAKLREALERYRGLCVHWNVSHHETCFRPADEALKAFDEGGDD